MFQASPLHRSFRGEICIWSTGALCLCWVFDTSQSRGSRTETALGHLPVIAYVFFQMLIVIWAIHQSTHTCLHTYRFLQEWESLSSCSAARRPRVHSSVCVDTDKCWGNRISLSFSHIKPTTGGDVCCRNPIKRLNAILDGTVANSNLLPISVCDLPYSNPLSSTCSKLPVESALLFASGR